MKEVKMADQTKDEIRIVQEINKARNHERKKKDKIKIIKDLTKKLNLFCTATDRADDNGFSYLYIEKAEQLIKKYADKL